MSISDEEQAQIDEFEGRVFVDRVSVNDKTLLHSFDLHFPTNGVTAILGPSGAGKTTLLQMVIDAVPSGVTAKGIVRMPGSTAFVPQEDQLHGFYTCRSYLHHYARLCGIPLSAATPRVEELLKQLGLLEQADNGTIVGDVFLKGLSGGQRRRLSVALECVSHPTQLVLDEPTSGLDAESALKMMEFLKSYARAGKGRRVVLTIHQPSSFLWQTIDHVILLSKGKLMYEGSREHMESFFESSGYPTPSGWNPADHYVTVVNDEFSQHQLSVNEWAELFANWQSNDQAADRLQASRTKSIVKAAKFNVIETFRASNPLEVAVELVQRYFLNLFFNPGILATRVAMYVMLALMVGALFWNLGNHYDLESVESRTAILFYCVAFFVFMSVAVMPFTVMERAIVDKEVQNKYYHPAFYQLAQGIASIPSTVLLAFLTTTIVVSLTKLNGHFWYFLNMFLSLVVAEALAQLVSHVVPHFIIGMAMLAGLYGFFMLVQGFMLVPSAFPNWLRWTHYIAFHTYAWRTFMFSEFDPIESLTGSDAFQTGADVLTFYEIDNVNRVHDMITLVGYALVVHFMSFIVLHLRYVLFRAKIERPAKKVKNSL